MTGDGGVWDRLVHLVGQAIVKLRASKAIRDDARILVIVRNDASNTQFVGGEVPGPEVAAFLRRAADRFETSGTRCVGVALATEDGDVRAFPGKVGQA